MTAAPGPYDAHSKSPQEIEEDIETTRSEIGDILAALEAKLAPRHMLERGVDMMTDAITGKGARMSGMIGDNPLPLALIGAGIGWMLLARRADRTEDPLPEMDDIEEMAFTAPIDLPHSLDEDDALADYARARPRSEGWDRARDALQQADDYARYARDRIDSATKTLTGRMNDHPLTVGAIGLVIGAAIGLMLPKSRIERRLSAPAGEQLREQAASLGREVVETARTVAERAVDNAIDAAKSTFSEIKEEISAMSAETEASPDFAGPKPAA